MNMVMIYGPTAAGKRTVAHALADATGYKVLDNHQVFSAITPIFPFEDPKLNEVRARLGNKWRREIFEEAAIADVSFIATMIIRDQNSFPFIRDNRKAIESHGGKMLLVQLLPSLETLMERVESPTRLRDKVTSAKILQERFAAQPVRFDKFPDFDHLTIDNSDLSPDQTAGRIASHYHLPLKNPARPDLI